MNLTRNKLFSKIILLSFIFNLLISQSFSQGRLAPCQIEPSINSPILVIKNVTLIDGTGTNSQPNMTIVIKGNRIIEVGLTKKIKPPRGAKIVEAKGKFLIPGLWDLHVHLNKAKESALPLFIANGVTSIRDMGGNLDEIKAMRDKGLAGKIIAPRIKLSGQMLESPQTFQRVKTGGKSENWDANRIAVEKPEDAERIVKTLVENGADFIKIRTYASPETYFAIAKACRDLGVQLVGHSPAENIDIIKVLDAGQASFEHAFYPYPLEKFSAEERKNIISAFVRNKTAVVPTLVAWNPRTIHTDKVKAIVEDSSNQLDFRRQYLSSELISYWEEIIKFDRKPETAENLAEWQKAIDNAAKDVGVMYQNGVRIMPGTDVAITLVYPGFSLHDELEMFVTKIGLTPMQAIESATRVPAEFMGMQDCLGTIEKGKIADLVLLEANPAENINNIRKINGVFKNGKYHTRKDLDKILQGLSKVTVVNFSE